MNEQEIAALVVRLTGDSTNFVRMCDQSAQAATRAAAQVQQQTTRIEGFATGLRTFAGAALGLFAGLGLAASLGGALNAFIGFEQQQLRLRAAIESTGQAVGPMMEKFKAYTDQVTSSTLVTRPQVNAMLEQATVLGFVGDQAEQVVTKAVALAKGNGEMAQGFLRVAAMIQRGHPEFARRILGLQGITDKAELAAKVHQRLASGLQVAESMMNSTGGQIEMLKRSFLGLTRDVGELVAIALMPMIKGLRSAVDWFKALDPMVKRVSVAIVAVLGAIVSLGPVLAFLEPVLAVLGTVASVLTGPWGLAIAAVVAGVVIVVRQLGGLQATWDLMKGAAVSAWGAIRAKAAEFWAWMQPVWDAMESLGTTAWGMIEAGAVQLWGLLRAGFAQVQTFVLAVWNRLTGGAVINWNAIRDTVRDAILFAEFTLQNFSAVAEHIWTGIELFAISALNTILNNIYLVLAGPVILSYLAAFFINWRKVFDAIWQYTKTIFVNLTVNVITFFDNVQKAVRGLPVDWSNAWREITNNTKLTLTGLEFTPLTKLEKQLREAFDRQGAALGESFETFRKRKLGEFAAKGMIPPEVVKAAADAGGLLGGQFGDEFNKMAQKGVEKFDAALSGSAEAGARIAEWQDRLKFGAAAGGAGGTAGAAPLEAVAAGGAEAVARKDANTDLLRQIRDVLVKGDKKPALNVEQAELA